MEVIFSVTELPLILIDAIINYTEWMGFNLRIALNDIITNFHFLLIGLIAGMVLGVIPGMGGTVTLTILLPFTLGLDPIQAFIMLTASIGATTYAGSLTAILINTPGTSSNAATLIDGYPLTQQGESETAITISAIASAVGAIIGIGIFILLIPVVARVAIIFGPSEITWIILFAIVLIPIIVAKRPVLGLATAALGCLIALIGMAPQTAEPRFTFEILRLRDGIPLVSMVIGFFAVSELVRVASTGQDSLVDFDKIGRSGSKMKGLKKSIESKYLIVRGSIIGVLIGAVPGAGGPVAAFVSYAHASQVSKEASKFGKGAFDGVLAPEAANDSKDGGQLFPTLGLGIPGTGSMAIFLGALLLHGIFPGPRLLTDELQLVMAIAVALLISNILTSIIGLAFASTFTNILKLPLPFLFTIILSLALASVFIYRSAVIDWYFALLFSIFGIILVMAGVSRIPFLIGFILAALLETNFFLAIAYANYDIPQAMFTGTLNQILIIFFIVSVIGLLVPRGIFTKAVDTLFKRN